jgi:asparagine synthase (glutamine-hydrolysing)
MISQNGRFVIIYNGEVYNFKLLRVELEKKGYCFKTQTDTEVLLEGWNEWGAGVVEKIDGIFAFAVYDILTHTLCLVRDHLGIKPLFYFNDGNEIRFSSEPLAMFGNSDSPQLSAADMDSYFSFNYMPLQRSGLQGVAQVLPGTICTFCEQEMVERSYWSPKYNLNPRRWSQHLIEDFADLIIKVVSNQRVSDVPLGVFLSGGLDSYIVSKSLKSCYSEPIKSFTMGFHEKGFDEAPAAKEYAKSLNITNKAYYFRWDVEQIIHALDANGDLLADPSCFPLFQLSEHAKDHITVALVGDGGDELLAGYDTYKTSGIMSMLRMMPAFVRRRLRDISRVLPSDNKRYGMRPILQRLLYAAEQGKGRDHSTLRIIMHQALKKRLYEPDFYEEVKQNDPINEYASLINVPPKERSYLVGRLHADLKFHLPSILAKVDRMSMAHGLELRVPLLSKEVVEFCLNVEDQAKLHMGKGKRLMRQMIFSSAPKGAISRPKAGFLPPVDSWFRGKGPMVEVFNEYVSTAQKGGYGYLRWDEVRKLLAEHQSRRIDAGFVFLGILQFINLTNKLKGK